MKDTPTPEPESESFFARQVRETDQTMSAFNHDREIPAKALLEAKELARKIKHLVNVAENLQKQNRELREKLEGFPPPEPEPAPSAFLTNRLRMHLHRVSDSLADYVNLPPSTLSDAVRLNALLVKVSALHEAFMHLEEKGRPY
jgi:hypothetical protein